MSGKAKVTELIPQDLSRYHKYGRYNELVTYARRQKEPTSPPPPIKRPSMTTTH